MSDWEIIKHGIGDLDAMTIRDENCMYVAEIVPKESDSAMNMFKNANLIKNAPKMYSVLKKVEGYLDNYNDSVELIDSVRSVIRSVETDCCIKRNSLRESRNAMKCASQCEDKDNALPSKVPPFLSDEGERKDL